MPVVMPEKLRRLIVALYQHAGVKLKDGLAIADQQPACNLSIHAPHAMHLLPTYLATTWCSLPLRRRG